MAASAEMLWHVRIQTADQIINHIRAKANLAPSPAEGPEAFLERTARDLRNQARFVERR